MTSRPSHRVAALRFSVALLYGALVGLTTLAALTTLAGWAADARAADATLPGAPPAGVMGRAPHLALILPLNSPAFARHADAVRQGFLAARTQARQAPAIRIYPIDESTGNVLTVYEQALEAGAEVVVGPLTRNGVAALAASGLVTVPTLALNAPEAGVPLPRRLYVFGLAIEVEARQAARVAYEDGRRNAFVVRDTGALSARMQQAFLEAFTGLGGAVVADLAYGADAASLARLRGAAELGVADMVFLALDFAQARIARPYLGTALAVYATSQIHVARTDPLGASDLNFVHFVDMPWLLQADHPAVMVYPRARLGDALEFERMYALGIDAFRIGLELARNSPAPAVDGVTGRIHLERGQQFVRDLTVAQFVDGKAVVVREPRP